MNVGGLIGFHPDFERDFPYPAPINPHRKVDDLHVVVIGALNREKGADLFEELAIQASKRKLPLRFSLIGYAYRKLDSVIEEHGDYQSNELDELLSRIRPSLVWFPTRCAETYSYVLSAVLRQGIPVVAPNIGAFSERTIGRALTWIVDANTSVNEYADLFLSVKTVLEKTVEGRELEEWDQYETSQISSFSYFRDYLAWEPIANRQQLIADHGLLPEIEVLSNDDSSLFRERLLSIIVSFKSTALIRLLQRIVPYYWQKRIKRALSTKPVHKLRRF
jgi:glycosyltransferase involved in cell wall biosynthesis